MNLSKSKFGAGAGAVAVAAAAALLITSASGPALAQEVTSSNSNGVDTQVRKSVSVTSASNGEVQSSVMVTQVASAGNGNKTIEIPIGTSSARNLDGFSGFPVNDDTLTLDLNVNGSNEERLMSTSTPGPITVKAEATLDGKPIEPSEVVNKTGVLKVTYTIINTAKQEKEVEVMQPDGTTKLEKQVVDAPIGGSAEVVLPPGFNEISAPGANIGGDGQGNNKLSYSVVMFRPLGNPVATISYESRVTDGTLPAAEFTMLPIIPMENSSVATARGAFEGGAETGATIAGAGKQIGDGAGELGTGIAKAADGAGQLATGLAPAADGAAQLATGLAPAAAGAAELASGLGGAVDGSRQLANGLSGQIAPGASELASKLAEGAEGSSALVAGAAAVNDAIQQLNAGVNTANPPNPSLVDGAATVSGGVALLQSVLADPDIDTLNTGATGLQANTATVQGAMAVVGPQCVAPNAPTCTAMVQGINDYIAGADQIAAGAEQLSTELIDARPLVAQLAAGAAGVSTGIATVGGGLSQLAAQTPALAAGAEAASQGLQAAAEGAGELSAGINTAADGANQLADGLPAAADGATQLADGLPAAADGAAQLAAGLPAAADGAAELAAGLPAAVDGADKLSAGGQELEKSGLAAEAGFANQVAEIDAVQAAGLAGDGIPYGKATSPDGNVTTTGVYQINLAAAQTPNQNNAVRFGLAAIGLVIAGAIGTAVYRRSQA